MKRIFINLALFVCLMFALFGLTGCPGGTTVQNTSNESAQTSNANTRPPVSEEDRKKSPHYRPLEKAVDEADIKNLDGTTFKLADKRGKVILLNLWATWCGPCRAEMPTLVRMQDAFRDQGFEVIGLNTDDEPVGAINEFAAELKLNYTLAWADTNLQTALVRITKFGGIPQSFIIDREGNLRGVFRGAGPAEIKKMEELVTIIVQE